MLSEIRKTPSADKLNIKYKCVAQHWRIPKEGH